MRKKFNAAGLCVSSRHYMVDVSGKIDRIIQLVEDGEYFTIDRPRQFGKTTTLSLLEKRLNQLFLDFLGMLRNKYLQRNEGRDFTFQSVILAGVHDVKTLKRLSGRVFSQGGIFVDL